MAWSFPRRSIAAAALCVVALPLLGKGRLAMTGQGRHAQADPCNRQPPPRFLQRLRARLGAKARRNETAAWLHVGANDLSMPWELAVYGELAKHSNWRLVLVEPSPSSQLQLRKTLARLGLPPAQMQIVDAALCQTSALSVPFFTFRGHDDRYNDEEDRHPLPPKWGVLNQAYRFEPERLGVQGLAAGFSTISSFDRNATIVMLEDWLRKFWADWAAIPAIRDLHLSLEEVKAWAASHIQNVGVRCITAAELLQEAGLAPEEVDALAVDAEGLESMITGQFLDMAAFAPDWLKLDMAHGWRAPRAEDASDGDVFREELRRRGYTLERMQQDHYFFRE